MDIHILDTGAIIQRGIKYSHPLCGDYTVFQGVNDTNTSIIVTQTLPSRYSLHYPQDQQLQLESSESFG